MKWGVDKWDDNSIEVTLNFYIQGKIYLLLSGWNTEFLTSHNAIQGRVNGGWSGARVSAETLAE